MTEMLVIVISVAVALAVFCLLAKNHIDRL